MNCGLALLRRRPGRGGSYRRKGGGIGPAGASRGPLVYPVSGGWGYDVGPDSAGGAAAGGAASGGGAAVACERAACFVDLTFPA